MKSAALDQINEYMRVVKLGKASLEHSEMYDDRLCGRVLNGCKLAGYVVICLGATRMLAQC